MFTFLRIFFFLLFQKQKNLQHQQQRASLKGLERSPADVSPVRGDEQELISEMSEANKGKHPGRKTRREAAASLSHVASSPGAPLSKPRVRAQAFLSAVVFVVWFWIPSSSFLSLLSPPPLLRQPGPPRLPPSCLSSLPAPLAPSPSPLTAFTFIPLCLPAH